MLLRKQVQSQASAPLTRIPLRAWLQRMKHKTFGFGISTTTGVSRLLEKRCIHRSRKKEKKMNKKTTKLNKPQTRPHITSVGFAGWVGKNNSTLVRRKNRPRVLIFRFL